MNIRWHETAIAAAVAATVLLSFASVALADVLPSGPVVSNPFASPGAARSGLILSAIFVLVVLALAGSWLALHRRAGRKDAGADSADAPPTGGEDDAR